jgi:hypothetical protein
MQPLARGLFGGITYRRAATAGMPQHSKDETEMVGVQAGHETAHILERLAKCERLDECQNVALS